MMKFLFLTIALFFTQVGVLRADESTQCIGDYPKIYNKKVYFCLSEKLPDEITHGVDCDNDKLKVNFYTGKVTKKDENEIDFDRIQKSILLEPSIF